jgi:hypothetical protein
MLTLVSFHVISPFFHRAVSTRQTVPRAQRDHLQGNDDVFQFFGEYKRVACIDGVRLAIDNHPNKYISKDEGNPLARSTLTRATEATINREGPECQGNKI